MRKVAAESIVLLKNTNAILPLNPNTIKKIAIVGGNAKAIVLSGGGSAALKPSYFVSPYNGIVAALPQGVDVLYSEGASSAWFFYLHNEGYVHVCFYYISLHGDAHTRL
jgi:beta-glucosidase